MDHKNDKAVSVDVADILPSLIDQTSLIHDDLSYRHDFTISDGISNDADINALDYQWLALPDGHAVDGAVMASCLGLQWQGVPNTA